MKIKPLFFAALFLTIAPLTNLQAQAFRFGGGVMVAGNNIEFYFNGSTYNSSNGIRQLITDTQFLGYQISGAYIAPLGGNAGLTLSAGWFNFGDIQFDVVDPQKPTITLQSFSSKQQMVSLSAGLELAIFRLGLGVYLLGELQYNILFASAISLPIDLQLPETSNRIGGAVGVGLDLNLGGFGVDIQGKYNLSNLIGRTTNEITKPFVSITASILLGKK